MPSDHEVAADVATRAGAMLLALREEAGASAYERWTLRDEGDWSAHHFIVDALATLRPGDKVLSEEGVEDRNRLGADRVWIVDPLDGTREFGEPGRTDWAVHVALWEGDALLAPQGTTPPGPPGNLVAGAVALPAQDRVLSTAEPPPPLAAGEAPAKIRIVVSRSRPPQFVRNISGLIDAELVSLGSGGAKVVAVLN